MNDQRPPVGVAHVVLQTDRMEETARFMRTIGMRPIFDGPQVSGERGGIYSKAANWAPYVQVDSKLVTGQNPTSSGPGAEELLKLLRSV